MTLIIAIIMTVTITNDILITSWRRLTHRVSHDVEITEFLKAVVRTVHKCLCRFMSAVRRCLCNMQVSCTPYKRKLASLTYNTTVCIRLTAVSGSTTADPRKPFWKESPVSGLRNRCSFTPSAQEFTHEKMTSCRVFSTNNIKSEKNWVIERMTL